jgi:hypothetical protein
MAIFYSIHLHAPGFASLKLAMKRKYSHTVQRGNSDEVAKLSLLPIPVDWREDQRMLAT